jgi:hypothetical protein
MADLATLSTVKRYVQPDDDSDDEVISDLIRYASAMIRTFTGRRFTTPPVTEQRSLLVPGRRSVRLDDKLTSVTAVSAPYPYERALTVAEYEVRSYPTVSELTFARPVEGTVLVTGTWGWSAGSLPADLEYATVVAADEWYRSNVVPSQERRAEGQQESRNLTLPREVQEILEPWRPGMLIA